MKINHAVLHVLDFSSGVTVFSNAELNMDDSAVGHFVERHMRHARMDDTATHAKFFEESGFRTELERYFYGKMGFMDFTTQLADFFASELAMADNQQSCDLLICDFDEDDPEEGGDGSRWFGMLLLTSRLAFMHEVSSSTGEPVNHIARHYAILPNPSQKVAASALIRARDMSILYTDKPRKFQGEERNLIADGLLQCESSVSTKETIETVTRIVEDVAEEFASNPTVALAAAKSVIVEQVEQHKEVSPYEVGEKVFENAPQLKRRFEEEMHREDLPEKVEVERKQVQRKVRNHKIKTDTGIEISFPSEYVENSEFIEFVNAPNGLISIELKNIGSIENK